MSSMDPDQCAPSHSTKIEPGRHLPLGRPTSGSGSSLVDPDGRHIKQRSENSRGIDPARPSSQVTTCCTHTGPGRPVGAVLG